MCLLASLYQFHNVHNEPACMSLHTVLSPGMKSFGNKYKQLPQVIALFASTEALALITGIHGRAG